MCTRTDDPTQHDEPKCTVWCESRFVPGKCENCGYVAADHDAAAMAALTQPVERFVVDATRKGIIESGPDGWDAEASSIGLGAGVWPRRLEVGRRTFAIHGFAFDAEGSVTVATYWEDRPGPVLPFRVYND